MTSMYKPLQTILLDAKFYLQLKFPGRAVTWWQLLSMLLVSRGLWLLETHRVIHFSTTQKNFRNPSWWIARILEVFGNFRNAFISRSELLGDCKIGVPTYLSDKGYIICGAECIGAGSIIHDHTTFGFAVAEGKSGRPRIGSNVWIGPNCITSGPITIGDGCTILPGTHITFSTPPNSVVRGNPAKIIQPNFDNTHIRMSLEVVTSVPGAK